VPELGKTPEQLSTTEPHQMMAKDAISPVMKELLEIHSRVT
jgi:hypothetical protein